MKKVKKIIGWAILAVIIVCLFSVPMIQMGWRDGLIIWAIGFALFGLIYWAVNAITGE